jgi:hypothetical protein
MSKDVKNFIKNPKKITAPINFQSSPDSPEATLAYITQPEIDMLVKANIHGSMKGRPNVGPMGIMSLDGGDDSVPETKIRTDGGSFGKDMGVTIDTSTKAGQDKRQEFRDRTGSNVVTERERQGREDLGRDPADTSAPPGGIQTVQEEEKKSNAFTDFVDDIKGMGGINPAAVIFGKGMDILTKPQKKDFLDEKDLAAMALNLQGKTEEERQQFFDTYRDVFSDAFKDEMDQFEKDQGFSVNPDDLLKQKFDTALKKSQSGALGKGSQTVTNPEEAYKDTIAVTTSQQVDIARLDPKKYPKLADKIFQARMDLNQKGRDPFTGNPTGGGIPSVNTGGGGSQTDTDTSDPGFPDYRFRDLGIAPFASYNPDDVMVDFSNYQATRGPLSSITNAKDGGIMRAADGAMVSISMTPLPITNIQEIKMDKQKYRDNMMREEIARSSMTKDVDLAPNFSMDA